MNLADLKKPFPVKQITWRVGATDLKKQQREKGQNARATKGIALAYIDARDVMERLDAVVGIENYQVLHPHANGKTSCRIGIKIGDEWVWKENGAGDSAMDAEKGAFSDSFKRAAVLWGIGRYLYDVPNIWVDLDEWGKIKDPDDPRLVKALDQAAKGIRGSDESEPEVKKTPKQWLDEAEAEIKKLKTPEQINQWVNDHPTPQISPKQADWYQGVIKSAMERTCQAPVGGVQ